MERNIVRQQRPTLSKDLTRKLILTVSLIFFITSFLSAWFFSLQSKKDFLNKHAEYLSYLGDNLQTPLWNLDKDTVDSICASFANNESVSLLRVINEQGNLLYALVEEDEPSLVVTARPVYHGGELVGTVELGLTNRVFQHSNQLMLYRSMVPMLCVILGLILTNRLLFNRFLDRPLGHLINRIEEISAGNYKEPANSFQHAEVQTILEKFNYMANRVKNREHSLMETNTRLEAEISDRQEAELAQLESEQRYQQLVDELPVGIFKASAEPDGRFLMVNSALTKMLGYRSEQELTSQEVHTIHMDPEKQTVLLEMLTREGTIQGLEVEFKKKDGHALVVMLTAHAVANSAGRPVYIDGIVEDVSARYTLEKQIRQTQKMEAIGTLAGGIAHDFNNILMGIQGRISLAQTLDMQPGLNEHLLGMEQYVSSAANLTKQLLGFARSGKYELKLTDLNAMVKKTADMFSRTRKEITLACHLQPQLWSARVDRGQVEQVLLNLMVNAWQAMPGGGRLDIETANREISGAEARLLSLQEGKYIRIACADTGTGMDEATKAKIFEPFFTTKDRERGTGLGLASAYGIIKNHNGTFQVQSKPGHGSTLSFYLPATEAKPEPAEGVKCSLVKGDGTILLVDDEYMIIEVASAMLEHLGYSVRTVTNGSEALACYSRFGHDIALVILDMVMPGLSGEETYAQLKKIDPSVKVLLSSGYSCEGQAEAIMAAGCDGFIQKPFNLAALSTKIGELLHHSPANTEG